MSKELEDKFKPVPVNLENRLILLII